MEKSTYVYWRIENITFWHKETHGEYFIWESSRLGLYPRGLDGEGDHFVVRVSDPCFQSRIEISFIGADGSPFCKREVLNPVYEGDSVTIEGPKFEEYVRTIKKNKDVLTLRIHRSESSEEGTQCTLVDVLEKCVKVPSLLLKKIYKRPVLVSRFYFRKRGDSCEFKLSVGIPSTVSDFIHIYVETAPRIFRWENFLIHVSASLLDSQGVLQGFKEDRHVFVNDLSWDMSTAFRLKEVKENNFSILLCVKFASKHVAQMFFHESVQQVDSSVIGPLSSDVPSETVLSDDLMRLYKEQDFCDFQLKCQVFNFPVHKAVLSARSPVFKSMLSCDVQEADIRGMDPSTLARFLTFLYTGRVQDLQTDVALNLYRAADEYQVPTLKKECVDFFCGNLSFTTLSDVLLLANKYQEEHLKSVIQEFIRDNKPEE